ncbi:hypothetical protein [Microcoleus sp. CAWBG640]|uniref:hypothetical protein n=1 Tax=Microcoleus sp. CAWBG640 TaxID=2841653 RepID=UPI00312BC258
MYAIRFFHPCLSGVKKRNSFDVNINVGAIALDTKISLSLFFCEVRSPFWMGRAIAVAVR